MWFFPPKLAHFDREDVVFHRIKVDQSYSFACEITNLFCWFQIIYWLQIIYIYISCWLHHYHHQAFLLVTSLVMAKNPWYFFVIFQAAWLQSLRSWPHRCCPPDATGDLVNRFWTVTWRYQPGKTYGYGSIPMKIPFLGG